MPRVPVQYITSPQRWSVVTAPVRFAIVEAMRDLAPCGIRAIASRLQVKPDTLYRHIELLIDAGFVVHAGFRKVPRATEQLFDLSADDFNIRFDSNSDPGPANDMVRDTALMFFKQMGATAKRTAAARGFDTTEAGRNTVLVNDFCHFTPTEFEQLTALLRKVTERVNATRGRVTTEPTRLYSVLLAAIPVTPRTRKTRNGKKPGGKKASRKKELV
jgi:hypothetical protein